jgi:hypothetical protein
MKSIFLEKVRLLLLYIGLRPAQSFVIFTWPLSNKSLLYAALACNEIRLMTVRYCAASVLYTHHCLRWAYVLAVRISVDILNVVTRDFP